MKANEEVYQLSSLDGLKRAIAQQYTVYEVTEDSSETLHWSDDGDGQSFREQTKLPLTSPKAWLFAEKELLYIFDGQRFVETLPEASPQAFWGVRACDLAAIAYTDQFFADDPYYKQRREKTFLVGVDCIIPCKNGFCSLTQSGPFVDGYCDLVIHPVENGNKPWLLRAVTEKGQEILNSLGLDKVPSGWQDNYLQAKEKATQAMLIEDNVRAGVELIVHDSVSDQTWEKIAVQCTACTGCTSVCPTCSCYVTESQPVSEENASATHVRYWDSCLLEGFQKEASGHNPTAEAGQRVKRFWRHKFGERYKSEMGRWGCVGCGRCDDVCVGVIGARSLFKRVSDS